jgi:hypothetical protein
MKIAVERLHLKAAYLQQMLHFETISVAEGQRRVGSLHHLPVRVYLLS